MSVLSNTGIRAGASAGGGSPAPAKYVEEAFSTFLYTGNGSTQAIENGIDLRDGGLVWSKPRESTDNQDHILVDSAQTGAPSGKQWYMSTNSTAQRSDLDDFNFSENGYTAPNSGRVNADDVDTVSWTFRKTPGFFDVVQYTGDRTGTDEKQDIEHSLGCIPGCIIIKETDDSGNWYVYHKHQPSHTTETLFLNTEDSQDGFTDGWGGTAPTSTHFTVGAHNGVNQTGQTYVAYLFADGNDSDAKIFGDGENEAIIQCGKYIGSYGENPFLYDSIGWQPQWLLLKNSMTSNSWIMVDTTRGWTVGDNNDGVINVMYPHQNNIEGSSAGKLSPRADGLHIDGSSTWVNKNNDHFVYIAIRSGLMKPPTDATTVFAMDTYGGTAPTPPQYTAGFPPDMEISIRTDTTDENNYNSSRLAGQYLLYPNEPDKQVAESNRKWDYMDGMGSGTGTYSNYQSYLFRRARGFFDVVIYKGTGSAQGIAHNLGATPEMMFVKSLSSNDNWAVYHHKHGVDTGTTAHAKYMRLNNNSSYDTWGPWNNTAPTATAFSVGAQDETNKSGEMHIAYLFRSCPGVSKVWYYEGTGGNINVDCDFTGSARFVLVKRGDDDGEWYVWDTKRGINPSGTTEPYIRLNTISDQITTTDYINPYSEGDEGGFTISSNASGDADINSSDTDARYLFLAIA